MSETTVRGRCPQCWQVYALRQDGTLPMHSPADAYGVRIKARDGRRITCDGSRTTTQGETGAR